MIIYTLLYWSFICRSYSWRQNSCNALLLAWVQEFLPRRYPKISTCQMRFLSEHQSHWWWLRQRMIIDKPAGASMLLLMLRPCLRYVLLWKASTPDPVIERKSRIQQSKSGQTSRTAGHWHRYRRYRHSLDQSQLLKTPNHPFITRKALLALVRWQDHFQRFVWHFQRRRFRGFAFFPPKQLLVWPTICEAHGLCTKALPPKHGGWESEAAAWPFVKHWLEMPEEAVARCCELCHLWFRARHFESFGLVRNELLRHLLRFGCLAGCLLVIGNLPHCIVTQEFREHHRIDTWLLGVIGWRSLFAHFSLLLPSRW